MAIVKSDLVLDLDKIEAVPWAVREAQLNALREVPESGIDYSDIPPMTDEQLARARPFREAVAERKQAPSTVES